MQISALSVRQLNVQGLVIYMTLALERRDFRGPGQLRFQLQPQIHSHHLYCHFQLGRLATTVLVELPNYGSCVGSEKHLAILIPWLEREETLWTDPSSALEVDREGSSEGSHLQGKSGCRQEVYGGDFMFAKASAALSANGSVVRCWQFSELKESRNITASYNTQDSQEKDSS